MTRAEPSGLRCTCCQREELIAQDGTLVCVVCDLAPDDSETELDRHLWRRALVPLDVNDDGTVNEEGSK